MIGFFDYFVQLHVNTINRIESLQFYDADERYSILLN